MWLDCLPLCCAAACRNVVHRDLKLENLLLTTSGDITNVKIAGGAVGQRAAGWGQPQPGLSLSTLQIRHATCTCLMCRMLYVCGVCLCCPLIACAFAAPWLRVPLLPLGCMCLCCPLVACASAAP